MARGLSILAVFYSCLLYGYTHIHRHTQTHMYTHEGAKLYIVSCGSQSLHET